MLNMESEYDNAERRESILRKNGIINVENKITFKSVNKIKIFLPKELLEKNKNKDFKHFELYKTIWLDSLHKYNFKPISSRVILIKTIDEGYNYEPINFHMNELSDEEFDEFLKIFDLQGSCTSRINL